MARGERSCTAGRGARGGRRLPCPFLREGQRRGRGRANGGQSWPPPALRGSDRWGRFPASGGGRLPSGRAPPGRLRVEISPPPCASRAGGEGEAGPKRCPVNAGAGVPRGSPGGPAASSPAGSFARRLSPRGAVPTGGSAKPLAPSGYFGIAAAACARQGRRPTCHLRNNAQRGTQRDIAKGRVEKGWGSFERGEEGAGVARGTDSGAARLFGKERV